MTKKKYFKAEIFLHDVLRQQLKRAKPIAKKHIASATNMLAEIKEKRDHNIFSKDKPMHVFFAEVAAKARIKIELDLMQEQHRQLFTSFRKS